MLHLQTADVWNGMRGGGGRLPIPPKAKHDVTGFERVWLVVKGMRRVSRGPRIFFGRLAAL